MTDRKSAVLAAINRIELDPVNPFDNQRYFDWLGEAQTMLEKERKGAGSPVEAIIVYSTGCPSQFEAYCTRQVGSANKAKGMGITVIGVCNPQARPFGFPVLPEGHCRSLQQAASPGYYHPLQEGIKVSEDLRGLFHAGDGLKLAGLTLTEWLGPGVSLVPGSAVPSPRIAGPQLTFEWGELLPGQTVTTTYRVAPTSTGQLPLRTNDSRVTFEDSLDRGPDPLPVPSRVLTVTECALLPTPTAPPTLEPTPSPTESPLPTPTQPAATATPAPSATATATATSVPGVVFLPVALRGVCKPGLTPVDVVLAIDASTSMLDPSAGTTKIAAAQEAARRFIQLLDARRDHAAIVAFNAEARLAQVLTGDKVALERAVNAIRPEPGTRIDLAVALGASELASPRGQPGGTRVLVLMSDGRSDGSTADAALAAANAAKQAGVSLYTIGLGDDVDDALLRQMASGPTTYFQAPDAAALAAIYEGVARALPCPGGVEWAPDQFGHPLKYGWSTSSQ
jgi:Mg-chelatase subunit ChlD